MAKFILSAFADEIHEDFDIQLKILKKHDVRFIELRSVDGKNVCDHTIVELKELKSHAAAEGIGFSAVGSPLGKIGIEDDFAPELEKFKRTLEIAHTLETKYIRMFSFFIPKGKQAEDYRDEVLNRWRQYVEAAQGSGITLLHENEKDIYGDTAARCLDLLKTLNTPIVKATFDPANFVQCGEETYPYAFKLLKDYVVYMHIKDALFANGEVVPSGEGDGHVEEILKTLNDNGYEGFLSLEPHLGDFKGFAGLEQDSRWANEKEGGPKTFAVAAVALKKILDRLGAVAE